MWVDTASDGFKVTVDADSIDFCEDDTEDQYLIDGYKHNGQYEGETDVVPGWSIYLYQGDSNEPAMSTTTDEEGYYYFWVGEGDWRVEEGDKLGWYQVGVSNGGEYVYTDGEPEYCYVEFPHDDYSDYPVFNSILVILDEVEYSYADYRCNFYNEQVEDDGNFVDGFKYELTDDGQVPVPNWTIYAANGLSTTSTTTNDLGY
jgi:hypothetical protein